MNQFSGDFDQYSVAFKLAQARSRVHNNCLLVDALQRGVNYQLAVMMTGAALPSGQQEIGWRWEQWLKKAGEFHRNIIRLRKIQGGRSHEPNFIPSAMPLLVEEPEDPYAMDVDYITLGRTLHRENLLCSVHHSKEGHLSKQEGTLKKKKGNIPSLGTNKRRSHLPLY